MPKIKFKLFTIIIILLLISSTSFASDGLSISQWIVDSTLLNNGDLEISEYISFDFKDKFNGVFRNIVLEGSDGISEIKVYEMVEGNPIPYTLNMDALKGDDKVFKSEITNNIAKLMIFSPSKNESKSFQFKYSLKNIATQHTDTGELYYKFIGAENDTPIKYFSARINIPSINKDQIKIFAHGPSNGKIYFSEDDKIKLQVSDLPQNSFIEARVLFPKDFLSFSSKTANKTLQSILDEELSFTKELDLEAENKIKMKNFFSNISIIVTGVGALVVGFIFNKLRRDTDIYSNLTSLSPEDITPAELRLFYAQVSDSRSLMATIFDLARRGYIFMDQSNKSQDKETNFILKRTNKSIEDLISHELYLLNWLFNTMASGNSLSTKYIESYRKSYSGKFYKEFGLWQSKVKSDLHTKAYYDNTTKGTGFLLLFLSLAAFIISVISLANQSIYGVSSLFVAFVLFIYGLMLMSRKSDLGYVQYQLWKDYKKDLERKGKTPENYGESLLQDQDLIYGLAFGLPMKSLNNFKNRLSQTNITGTWMYWYFLTNSKGGSRFEDSLNSSFYGSSGTTTSTSFGGGGGFSGGGGGGAGGGGAGGF